MNMVCYEGGLLWTGLLQTWSVSSGLLWTGLFWTETNVKHNIHKRTVNGYGSLQ